MKITTKYLSMLLAVVLASVAMVSCGDDDDKKKDEPTAPVVEDVLKVGSNELLFGSNATAGQMLNITCNKEWTATVDQTWVDLSPKSGEGNGTLSISVNSFNETSKDRVAIISIKSGELEKEITVTQKASLVADCVVNPINLVVLADQIAFDAEWGSQASYFQFRVIREKDAKRMTDAEIIASMEDANRFVEQDDYFYICTNIDGEYLDPLSEYIICTLAHDEKGNRGDLVKTKVTTPSDSNQPRASVSITTWTGSQWRYTTTKNGYCDEYYDVYWTGNQTQALVLVPTVYYAYFIQRYIRLYPADMPPAISDGSWVVTPSYGPYITVASWAKGKNGVWSGVVSYDFDNMDWYSSASNSKKSAKKAPVKKMENGAVNIKDFQDLKIVRRR